MNIFKAQARLAAVEKVFADAGIDMEKALAEGLEAAITANADEGQPAEPTDTTDEQDGDQDAEPETVDAEPSESEVLASKLADAEARAERAEKLAKEAQEKAEAMASQQLKALRDVPPVVDGNAQGSTVYETYQAISDPAERAQYFAAHREEILRGQKANNQHGRA